MFGRRKNEAPAPPKERKGAELMSQMGLGDIESELYGDVDNDEDLEAELMALQGKPKPVKRKPKGPVNPLDFDRMIADSMKELDDADISDTEDPDLMDELKELEGDDDEDDAPVQSVSNTSSPGGSAIVIMLEERMHNYTMAIDNAKSAGETSKQKRADRGLKVIQDLLKKAKAGKSIDENDIPPTIAMSVGKKPQADVIEKQSPSVPQVYESTISTDDRKHTPSPSTGEQASSSHQAPSSVSPEQQICIDRQLQYKKAALQAKHSGDMAMATKYVKISKQFDGVIAAMKAGKEVDLSQMPPPPSQLSSWTGGVKSVEPTAGSSSSKSVESLQRGGAEEKIVAPPAPTEDEERSIFNAPDVPKTTLEALTQRHTKYANASQEAKEEGNTSKSRRMGRIAKQYDEAIKSYKAGRPVDFEELPTPPGFAPIPTGPPVQTKPAQTAGAGALQPPGPSAGQRSPQPAQRSPQPAQRSPQPQLDQGSTGKRPQPTQGTSQKVLKRGQSLRADQQTQFLRERMQEYKNAAIAAKKNNDIALAKQYLRMAKGFEPMIDAAESGLPVDLTQVPASLETENDNPSFVTVSREDCELSGDREEVFETLKQDLITQVRTCTANHSHFSKLGDVMSANKFQKMESGLRKDLDALKNALRHNDPVPKFHYENRTFSMVQCNTDLGDNDIEMTVVRGLQYNPPSGYSEKDLDTYIKFEFPFPTDDPQTGQTETVKSSFNPEYGEPVKMNMNRKSRALVRVIERKTIKLEIYYKRGFLKSDKLLGTVNVKLLPLETQCTVHECYDLTDGRKTLGGKLEVKLRIRDPFKNKQVEEVKEKWLVIDQFIKTIDKPTSKTNPGADKGQSAGTTCMEVLKFEKQQLDKQITSLRESLSETQLSALVNKSTLIKQKIDQQAGLLKTGGMEAWKNYVCVVEKDIVSYAQEAKLLAQHSDIQKAQLMLTKKKLAEKEVAAIRSKFPSI